MSLAVDAREAWGEELLLIIGGLSEDKQALGDVSVYQATSEAWFHPETSGSQPPARAFHCGAAVENRAYVFGGHAWSMEKKAMHKFNDLWCLNTDTWEWTPVEMAEDVPQPSARSFAAMCALPGSQLLLFGGLEQPERRLDDTWLFDTTTSTWQELKLTGSKPKARYAHAMTAIDGRAILFGGQSSSGLLNDLWTLKGLSPEGEASPVWIPLDLPGTPPIPRKGHSLVGMGLWVIVMGGHTAEVGWFRSKTDIFHNDVVLIDRSQQVRWRTPEVVGELPPPRELHSLTPLSDGRLLLFGGGNGKSIVGDAWWLDTESEPFTGRAPSSAAGAESWPQKAVSPAYAPSMAGLSTISGISALSMDADREARALDSEELARGLAGSRPARMGSTGASSAASPHAPAAALSPAAQLQADAWWAGAQEAERFQDLRSRIGLQPTSGTALQSVASASHIDEGAGPTAFSLPASGNAQDLAMRDVPPLLHDHHQHARGRITHLADESAVDSGASLQASLQTCRFAHMSAADVRLGDLPALLQEHMSLTGT